MNRCPNRVLALRMARCWLALNLNRQICLTLFTSLPPNSVLWIAHMPRCHCSSLQKHRINRIEQGYDSGYLVNQNNDHYRHASYFKL
jgi:hypothetical protein